MKKSQARRVIERFGGIAAIAKRLEKDPSTIYRWTYPSPTGTGGVVPSNVMAILAKTRKLQPTDFDPRPL